MSSLLAAKPFYTYVREERQFSFLLAHLLMQRGPALHEFLQLVAERAEGHSMAIAAEVDDAEVYVEFAPLRDLWDDLKSSSTGGRDEINQSKRQFILTLLDSVPSLRPIAREILPEPIPDFNAYFMSDAGRRIVRDIASPALWSVTSLAQRFRSQPDVFLDLCKVKWSFHIKPDIVVRIPGSPSLCIEAKVESGEGVYPSGTDARVVDEVFGKPTRVRQFELQRFMFDELLGESCLPVVVQERYPTSHPGYPVLIWGEVFSTIAAAEVLGGSIPFVSQLLGENRAMLRSYAQHRMWGGG